MLRWLNCGRTPFDAAIEGAAEILKSDLRLGQEIAADVGNLLDEAPASPLAKFA